MKALTTHYSDNHMSTLNFKLMQTTSQTTFIHFSKDLSTYKYVLKTNI